MPRRAVFDDPDAYYNALPETPSAAPLPQLSALEQMYGYYAAE
jgi:hypothetical protein